MKTIRTSIASKHLDRRARHGATPTSLSHHRPRPHGQPVCSANGLNNSGLITGLAAAPDGTQHAVLWYRGQAMDISRPGLGGPNSAAFGVNESGLVLVQAEGSAKDPNNENFCGIRNGARSACLRSGRTE